MSAVLHQGRLHQVYSHSVIRGTSLCDSESDQQTDGRDNIFVCPRVGQQDVDIKLSGHFIKEIHCVFVSETNEQGEGEMVKLLLNAILLMLNHFIYVYMCVCICFYIYIYTYTRTIINIGIICHIFVCNNFLLQSGLVMTEKL